MVVGDETDASIPEHPRTVLVPGPLGLPPSCRFPFTAGLEQIHKHVLKLVALLDNRTAHDVADAVVEFFVHALRNKVFAKSAVETVDGGRVGLTYP